MLDQVRKDVISELKDAYLAIREKRFSELHSISDKIVHSMAISQNKDVIDAERQLYQASV